MSMSALYNNTIRIRKENGEIIEGIKASVQSSAVFFDHNNIRVDPGDIIEHEMSNGATDTYEVLDPGFYEAGVGIPAHYQCEVRKLNIREAPARVKNIAINMSGPNARVNSHAIDNSTNISGADTKILELFSQLRQAVSKLNIDEREKAEAQNIVDGIEAQASSTPPNKSVLRALLGALPVTASITTIVSGISSLLGL